MGCSARRGTYQKVRTCPVERSSYHTPRSARILNEGGIMAKFDGKVALVTGASKGIGASIALHLAAEGAAVVVNYATDKAGADRIAGEITGSGGKAVAVQANLSKPPDVR